MATKLWTGSAGAVAQIQTWTPGQQPPNTVATITCNGKSLAYTSSSGTNDDIVAGLAALVKASTIPEFQEISFVAANTNPLLPIPNATYAQIGCVTAGKPVTVTISLTTPPTISIVRTTPGKAGVNELQKITIGPNAKSGSSFTLTFGANTTAAIPTPPSPPSGASGAAGNPNGTYYFKCTFVTANGETEASAASASVTVANQQITVTVPTGPATVQKRFVYRTVAGGSVNGPYHLIGAINDNVTATLTDNNADATISTANGPPATNYALQGALEALASGGVGNFRVGGANTAAISGQAMPTSSIVYEVEFINSLGNASQALLTGNVAAVSILPTITIVETQKGCPIQSEIQQLGWLQNYGLGSPSGYFKIAIAELNVTTSAIAYNASPAAVLSAIQAAAPPAYANSFAVASVQQTSAGYLYSLTYQGLLANLNVAQATVDVSGMSPASGDTVSAANTTTQIGSATGQNSIITVTLNNSPSGGNIGMLMTLANGNQLSNGSLPIADTGAQMASVFGTTCQGSGAAGGPYTFEAVGEAGSQPIVWGATSSMTTAAAATLTVSEVKAGAAAVNEVQTITISGATGGTLTYSFEGQGTGNVPYNETSGNVQADLTGLSTVGAGNMTVSGAAGGPYTVTAAGTLAGQPLPLISANGSKLTGTATTAQTLTTVQAASGPNFWDNAQNWFPTGVPVNGDDVWFQFNKVNCCYNIAQSAVTLGSLHVDMSYLGQIGLPLNNGKYFEYRNRFLQIGVTNLVDIGKGTGGGPSMVNLDFGTTAFQVVVSSTGNPTDSSTPVVNLKGVRAAGSSTLDVKKGRVGIATFAGDTCRVDTIRESWVNNQSSDASIFAGEGATITTWQKDGGDGTLNGSITTIISKGGTLTWNDPASSSATATTLDIQGGTVYHRATGNVATTKVGATGKYDRSQDMRPVQLGTVTLIAGATFNDPHGVTSWSGGLTLSECRAVDVTLELGQNISIPSRTQL